MTSTVCHRVASASEIIKSNTTTTTIETTIKSTVYIDMNRLKLSSLQKALQLQDTNLQGHHQHRHRHQHQQYRQHHQQQHQHQIEVIRNIDAEDDITNRPDIIIGCCGSYSNGICEPNHIRIRS